MTSARRALALVVLVAGTFVVEPAGAAAGWTPGACPTADGVTVIVDYQGLGGGTVTRCVTGAGDNGFAALQGAGFVVDQPVNTPNFVCRIDGAPGPGAESCVETPPHTAYWAYWRAKRGGAWVYSDIGAASKGTAKAGSVQGWSFSDGSNPTPRVAPPTASPVVTAPAPTAAPATAPAATAAPGGASGGAAVGSGGGSPSATAPAVPGAVRPGATSAGQPGSAGSPTPIVPGAPTTVVAGATDPGLTPSTTTPAADASVLGTSEVAPTTTGPSSTTTSNDRTIELASSQSSGDDSGSPVGTLVAVGVVGALAGATFVLRRRR